jgi:glycosyltransferase involved in cell wall biosynthesis
MPRVSVVIPTYNHAAFVRETLDSVFAQTYRDFEIVVINDGSPDNTEEVLKELIDGHRVAYVRQENAGQAAARNAGLKMAKGEYIAFLDDDDVWPADKLEWQAARLDEEPEAVLVYGLLKRVGSEVPDLPEETSAPEGWLADRFRRSNWIMSPGQTLIRAEPLREIGGFDVSLPGADDWDLYIRLAERGKFVSDTRVSLIYRMHMANASRNVWGMYAVAHRLCRKHYGLIPRPGRLRAWRACRRFISEFCFNHFVAQARKQADLAHWREAARSYFDALRVRPLSFVDGRLRSEMGAAVRRMLRPSV